VVRPSSLPSPTHKTAPVTSSAIPTGSGRSSRVAITSVFVRCSMAFRMTNATPAGIVPTTSMPTRRRLVVRSERNSRQKNATIATSDPAWTRTTKASGNWSSAPSAVPPSERSNALARTRCPELEIGKNSVRPWRPPSAAACPIVTACSLHARGPAPTTHRPRVAKLCRGGPPCPPPATHRGAILQTCRGDAARRPKHRLESLCHQNQRSGVESLCHRHLVHNVHPVHYLRGQDRAQKGRG